MKIIVFGVLFALVALATARNWRQLQRSNFIADGSNDVAVNILKSLSLEKKNAVFSPLGYNTILAILTEGARGNTRNQLVSALKLPEDTYAVRSTFKRVLSAMTERGALNKPEYKNWFYIYKNYTVEESFRKVLQDNYLVDVKIVDRITYEEEDPATSAIPSAGEETTEELNTARISTTTEKDDSSEEDDSKEKDKDSKEKDSKEKDSKEKDSKEKDSKEKDSKEKDSKEDNSNEDDSSEQKQKMDKKPSNVMKIKTKDESAKVQDAVVENAVAQDVAAHDKNVEKIKETSSTQVEPESPVKITSDEIVKAIDPMKLDGEKEQSSNTEIVQEPLEQSTQQNVQPLDESSPQSEQSATSAMTENSPAQENVTVDGKGRSKRETVSFLSVNNISSMENERETGLKKMTRMLVFNALYFKGNWSTPFVVNSEKRPFKVNPTDEVMVDMLHAEDDFEVGRVPDLDAWAIDLPYQGNRYSLMILVPAADDGLDGLIKRLPGFSFYNVDKHLTKLRTKVCIPKIQFSTISKPKDSFVKSGISDLFNSDADLSGISGSRGLYLEELVQLVQFEIDEAESSYNYLTTSQVSDLRGTPTTFTADEPFIFFLRDKVEDLNVVAGIVYNPLMPSEL